MHLLQLGTPNHLLRWSNCNTRDCESDRTCMSLTKTHAPLMPPQNLTNKQMLENIPVSALMKGTVAVLETHLLYLALNVIADGEVEVRSLNQMLFSEFNDDVSVVFVIFEIMNLVPCSQTRSFVYNKKKRISRNFYNGNKTEERKRLLLHNYFSDFQF